MHINRLENIHQPIEYKLVEARRNLKTTLLLMFFFTVFLFSNLTFGA